MKAFDEELRRRAANETLTETDDTREKLDRAAAVGEGCAPQTNRVLLRQAWAMACAVVLLLAGFGLWNSTRRVPDDLHAAATNPPVNTVTDAENAEMAVSVTKYGFTEDGQLVLEWSAESKREDAANTLFLWQTQGVTYTGVCYGAQAGDTRAVAAGMEARAFRTVWQGADSAMAGMTLTVCPVTLQAPLTSQEQAQVTALALTKTGDFPEAQAIEELGLGKAGTACTLTLKQPQSASGVWAYGTGRLPDVTVGDCKVTNASLTWVGSLLRVSFDAENTAKKTRTVQWALESEDFIGSGEEQQFSLEAGKTRNVSRLVACLAPDFDELMLLPFTWTETVTGAAAQETMWLQASTYGLARASSSMAVAFDEGGRRIVSCEAEQTRRTEEFALLRFGLYAEEKSSLAEFRSKNKETLTVSGVDEAVISEGAIQRVDSGWYLPIVMKLKTRASENVKVYLCDDASGEEKLIWSAGADSEYFQQLVWGVYDDTMAQVSSRAGYEGGFTDGTHRLVATFYMCPTFLPEGDYVLEMTTEGLPTGSNGWIPSKVSFHVSAQDAWQTILPIENFYNVPEQVEQDLTFRFKLWQVSDPLQPYELNGNMELTGNEGQRLLWDWTVEKKVAATDEAASHQAIKEATIAGVMAQGYTLGDIHATWYGGVITVDFDLTNTGEAKKLWWDLPLLADTELYEAVTTEKVLTLAEGETKACHAVIMAKRDLSSYAKIQVRIGYAAQDDTSGQVPILAKATTTSDFAKLCSGSLWGEFSTQEIPEGRTFEVRGHDSITCTIREAQRVGNRVYVVADFTADEDAVMRSYGDLYWKSPCVRLGDESVAESSILCTYSTDQEEGIPLHVIAYASVELPEGEDTVSLYLGETGTTHLYRAGEVTGFTTIE